VFTQLLASRPAKQRSTSGLVVSVVTHIAIVAAVIYATTKVAVADDDTPTGGIIYIADDPPPTQPVPAPVVPSAPVIDGFTGTVIDVPVVIPTTLPPIVPGGFPTPSDFPAGARFIPGGTPSTGGITAPPPGAAYFAEQVDVVVSIAKGSPVPAYPSALRPMGIDGSARFRFIVDSTGRVEPGSIEQVQATHNAFAFAVRNTLGRMRFTPAQVRGKAVRQLVELPFVFRVER
jgi:TonB family protein